MQDATAVYLLKLWPWVEANKNRIIGGTAAIVVVIFVISFFSWQRGQREIVAGQALTKLTVSGGGQTAEPYLKIVADHPGTLAARRAWLQGAAALFATGKYPEAQTQFQKFLDANPGDEFSGQAALGVAASLDAQGKTDLAAGAYQRVANGSSDAAVVNAAKFALARIDEAQGKYNDALIFYEAVARANASGSLGSEAAQRMMELRNKMPATTAPSTAPATLSH